MEHSEALSMFLAALVYIQQLIQKDFIGVSNPNVPNIHTHVKFPSGSEVISTNGQGEERPADAGGDGNEWNGNSEALCFPRTANLAPSSRTKQEPQTLPQFSVCWFTRRTLPSSTQRTIHLSLC